MQGKQRATKAQIARRVEDLLQIRLDGAEFWNVREFVREQEATADTVWTLAEGEKPLSDKTLWRYLSLANKMIAESCRSSRKRLAQRHLAQRRNLFAKAVSQGDIRAALSVLDSEAKLQGLFPPTKIAPTNPDGSKEHGELSDADRAAALANLYARVGATSGEPHPDGPPDGDGPLLDRRDENFGGR